MIFLIRERGLESCDRSSWCYQQCCGQREKAEQENTINKEYEFTAIAVKNTNVSTTTNLYRILFIYRVVINYCLLVTYFFLWIQYFLFIYIDLFLIWGSCSFLLWEVCHSCNFFLWEVVVGWGSSWFLIDLSLICHNYVFHVWLITILNSCRWRC